MLLKKIGRSPDNDIIIDRQAVSRHHAQIIYEDGKLYIVDCNSKNGTFVNGNKVTGRRLLMKNDKVYLGKFEFQWQSYLGSDTNNADETVYTRGNHNLQKQKNEGRDNEHHGSSERNVNIGLQQPLIPSDINIKQKNVNENINVDVYRSGDDFKVPFMRNVGNHIGNAVGKVGGCLVWVWNSPSCELLVKLVQIHVG